MHENGILYLTKDLRPLSAVEGESLLDFMYAAVELSRKNPRMTEFDLKRAIGTRN